MDEQRFGVPPPQTSTVQNVSVGFPQTSVGTNRNIAILAYISLLVIVPMIVSKDDPFIKFHVKQGLVLLIFAMIPWILSQILWQIYIFLPYGMYASILGIYGLIRLVFGIATAVFVVIGVRNVVNKRQEPLPFLGSFAKLFTF